MTFLWKKKSRMADLHSPSKNCDSQVLEIGFPTSFVDLVVKNKNRFKKLSSRRDQAEEDDQDWEISEPVLTSPLPPHLVNAEACADLVEFESKGSGSGSGEIEVEEELVRHGEVDDAAETGDDDGRKAAFVNVAVVLVVVVLGLSTRRFATAVALLAILLLLLKLIGRRLSGSSVPWSDAKAHCQGITSWLTDIFGTLWQLRNESEERDSLNKTEDVAERDVDGDYCNLPDNISEIDGAAFVDDIVIADHSFIDYEKGGAFHFSGINMRKAKSNRDEYFRAEHENHRRDQDAKLKSRFMKMIVPKKLKNPKIGRRNTVSCAMLSEVEQPRKENHRKVEEDEVQKPM